MRFNNLSQLDQLVHGQTLLVGSILSPRVGELLQNLPREDKMDTIFKKLDFPKKSLRKYLRYSLQRKGVGVIQLKQESQDLVESICSTCLKTLHSSQCQTLLSVSAMSLSIKFQSSNLYYIVLHPFKIVLYPGVIFCSQMNFCRIPCDFSVFSLIQDFPQISFE